MARASGSYPAGRWFKSDIRYHPRLVGQAVKTRPFHGCNSGSIPLRVTKTKRTPSWCPFCFVDSTDRPPRALRECGSQHCYVASVSEALQDGANSATSHFLLFSISKYFLTFLTQIVIIFSTAVARILRKDKTL